MTRMQQLHIDFLNEIIEECGEHADAAAEELAQIKDELAKQGIILI